MRTTFGAWAAKPTRADLELAASIGLQRIDLVCNDHAADRDPTALRLFAGVSEDAKAATALGLDVHLTSWVMPHEQFLDDGLTRLRALADECGASSIMLDAEEPWTQAHKPMAYDEASDVVAEHLEGIEWGVTAIGYAEMSEVGPLLARACYGCPQAYVVAPRDASSKQLGLDGIPRVLGHWSALGKPLVVGLAAYRQADIEYRGRMLTVEQAMRSSVYQATHSTGTGFTMARTTGTVLFWSLRQIAASHQVQRAIAALTEEAKAA